eukprot:3915858-Ditylum_brightwellii.AAC.1
MSSDTNQHTEDSPVHGSGQGAADSPANWGLISSVGLGIYNKKAHGCSIQDPTGEIKQQRNAEMFVNDLTAQHNDGQDNLSEERLMEITQHY